MTESDVTDRIVRQGQALVSAIESLDTTEGPGAVEHITGWCLLEV